MGVCLRIKDEFYEVGTGDFFGSFFDTIEVRLGRERFPLVFNELYQGNLRYESLDLAEKELQEICGGLKDFKPSEVVWDRSDLSRKPPWGDDISSEITDLSNYYITSDGQDLFEVLSKAIETARREKSGIRIE